MFHTQIKFAKYTIWRARFGNYLWGLDKISFRNKLFKQNTLKIFSLREKRKQTFLHMRT